MERHISLNRCRDSVKICPDFNAYCWLPTIIVHCINPLISQILSLFLHNHPACSKCLPCPPTRSVSICRVFSRLSIGVRAVQPHRLSVLNCSGFRICYIPLVSTICLLSHRVDADTFPKIRGDYDRPGLHLFPSPQRPAEYPIDGTGSKSLQFLSLNSRCTFTGCSDVVSALESLNSRG